MSSLASAPQAGAALAGSAGNDALFGLAALGKTGLALLLVIGLILLCSWLLRRLSAGQRLAGQPLKVLGSTALGQRERVVIVEVAGTWLVLGVAPGQISKLHELPAPPTESMTDDPGSALAGSFAVRLAQALKHNLRGAAPRQP
ncbi:flagellar biosynthetic protein FliO [Pseudomonas sp. MAP12]|uniref:Flagellar protein n=1 Tax=Geopseudomonas aromaticivorans TaxID=2849492 RepID=A0ABS6MTX3_9GAMM|nr:flagellar biosynthetic protein FliO [Pseudomonas aromaticivorans]MBV2132260.1 flagellar biosynthetic protein FliO [Pseudomonas aromaticivorans]